MAGIKMLSTTALKDADEGDNARCSVGFAERAQKRNPQWPCHAFVGHRVTSSSRTQFDPDKSGEQFKRKPYLNPYMGRFNLTDLVAQLVEKNGRASPNSAPGARPSSRTLLSVFSKIWSVLTPRPIVKFIISFSSCNPLTGAWRLGRAVGRCAVGRCAVGRCLGG